MSGGAHRGVARLGFLAVGVVASFACSREPASSRLVVPPGAPAEAPSPDPAFRWVTELSTLRREPNEQARVQLAGTKAPVPNALSTLHRGDQVRLLESREAWARVAAPDGTEGWLRATVLLPVDGLPLATVLVETWAFEQPDLLASNARRKLEPGTLLLVRNTHELFTEVEAGQGTAVWVLTDRLSTRPDDVAAAKLVERARLLQRSGKQQDAREVLTLLRARQPSSPLEPVLAAELGEAPSTSGGGAAPR